MKKNKHKIKFNENILNLSNLYGEEFYINQIKGSYGSAKKYVDILENIFSPKKVVDVGCGRGSWLKAFRENGAEILVGVDGPWNSQEKMIEDSISFYSADLSNPINIFESKSFDLAISLEVAEHLESKYSKIFIESLVNLSSVVLFGAAFNNQGGTNHINEQNHDYWAEIFISFNFYPFDLFRSEVWGDEEVEFWYQQNTFLYVQKDSEVYLKLLEMGKKPISNLKYLNCVHPKLYEIKVNYAENICLKLKKIAIKLTPIYIKNSYLIMRKFIK